MVAPVELFRGSGRMDSCTGIRELPPVLRITWSFAPTLPARFRRGCSAAWSSVVRKRRNELPATCSSGQ